MVGPSAKRRGRKPNPHYLVNGVDGKRCPSCKTWRPVTDYRKKARAQDGLTSQCVTCMARSGKAWRARRNAAPPQFPLDTIKECSRCKDRKPLTEFRRQATGEYGRQSACRACSDVYNDGWRRRARDKRLAYNRAYYGSKRGRRVIERYHERHPTKANAQRLMWLALKSGELVKPKCCESCGESKRLDGHHPDYAKPLDVMWLCRPCHKAWHREHGEGLNANTEPAAQSAAA